MIAACGKTFGILRVHDVRNIDVYEHVFNNYILIFFFHVIFDMTMTWRKF